MRPPLFITRSLLSLLCLTAAPLSAAEHWIYLDNDHIRLGMNMDAGGSIGWFSASRSAENLLNAFDHGRYVQQSYYGDADGSDWNGSKNKASSVYSPGSSMAAIQVPLSLLLHAAFLFSSAGGRPSAVLHFVLWSWRRDGRAGERLLGGCHTIVTCTLGGPPASMGA